MKDTNKEVKSFLEHNIRPDSKRQTVLRAMDRLRKMGMYVEDASEEMGYLNFRVRTEEGYVRVYKHPRFGYQIQPWKMVEFKYSGIPVFF